MSELIEHIEIEPPGPATATVIWLHGLGADGHDFEPLVPELKMPDTSTIHEAYGVRFIFPHAPVRPITINGGQEMRGWYDFIPHSEHESIDDITASSRLIEAIVENEIHRGIPSERIILAGFSQGGVIALHTGLRLQTRLAGILAISTYLHDASGTEKQRADQNLALPIMMAHGTMDSLIPIMRAATSRENLIRLGYDVRWFAYPIAHQVCLEEIDEVSRFFQELLG